MIALIIKSYFTILLSIGIGSLSLLVVGLYFILKKSKEKLSARQQSADTLSAIIETLSDISSSVQSQPAPVPSSLPPLAAVEDAEAIAGDDVITTQLDLARALIESSRPELAKEILEEVIASGNAAQQQEAQQLLATLLAPAVEVH